MKKEDIEITIVACNLTNSVEPMVKFIEEEKKKYLKGFIIKMYGKRCKEMGIGCVVCAMWELYDEYINKLKK